MNRWLFLPVIALMVAAAPASQTNLSGLYVEARTCEIWTGGCYGNAEMNLTGKNAVMAWKVQQGAFDQVRLDGLGVVAVIAARNTLGLEQTGPAKAILIVDSRANEAQRQALINLAKQQGGNLIRNVVAVESAPIDLTVGEGQNAVVARLTAGDARIQTRILDPQRDRACGSEGEFYPPLSRNVKARAAVAVEHSFTGKGFRGETWRDSDRRSAYVGRFDVR